MSAKSIRALPAADPGIGAGDVLSALAELGVGLDRPAFTFYALAFVPGQPSAASGGTR